MINNLSAVDEINEEYKSHLKQKLNTRAYKINTYKNPTKDKPCLEYYNLLPLDLTNFDKANFNFSNYKYATVNKNNLKI